MCGLAVGGGWWALFLLVVVARSGLVYPFCCEGGFPAWGQDLVIGQPYCLSNNGFWHEGAEGSRACDALYAFYPCEEFFEDNSLVVSVP